MTSFKTQQEIWKHLVEGGKIICGTKEGSVFGFKDGLMYNFTQEEIDTSWSFSVADSWLPYHEPLKLEFEAKVEEQFTGFAGTHTLLDLSVAEKLNDIAGKRFKVTMTEIVGKG